MSVRLAAGSPERAQLVLRRVGSTGKRDSAAWRGSFPPAETEKCLPGPDFFWPLLYVAAIGRRTEELWWGVDG